MLGRPQGCVLVWYSEVLSEKLKSSEMAELEGCPLEVQVSTRDRERSQVRNAMLTMLLDRFGLATEKNPEVFFRDCPWIEKHKESRWEKPHSAFGMDLVAIWTSLRL